MSKVRNVFITGGNRGIGLSLVKGIVAQLKPEKLFTTFRNVAQAKELHEFAAANSKCVQLIQMDVRDHLKFDEVADLVDKSTNGTGLNLLINNAGISSKYAKISGVKKEQLMENFEINTVGPILLTKALAPLLEKAAGSDPNTPPGIARAAIINISSILGSMSANDNGGMYPYRCSKAAINAATKSMSLDFKKSKIIATALHPGWVQTDMGGPKAPFTVEESTSAIIKLLESLNETHNGILVQYDGKKIDW